MSTYRDELAKSKAKRQGIVEQRSNIKSTAKHATPWHVDVKNPRWVRLGTRKGWYTWSKCRTENEAKAVLSKMQRTIGWEARIRDARVTPCNPPDELKKDSSDL